MGNKLFYGMTLRSNIKGTSNSLKISLSCRNETPPYVDIDVVSLNKRFLLYLGTVVLIFDCIALILTFFTFSSFSAVYHPVANNALKYMLHKEFIVNLTN